MSDVYNGFEEDKMDRKVYLNITDIEEAVAIYLEKIKPLLNSVKKETVDVRESRGRITSRPVFARISSPNHNAAAMDGIMVVAERTYVANEANPVVLSRGVDFEYINTGHVIREPYDSVIMIEDVALLKKIRVEFMKSMAGKKCLVRKLKR